MTNLRSLATFKNLHTLVLDHNGITSHARLPYLPNLQTLWLNHNEISNLSIFIENLAASCPRLVHLSLMNNAAAPSYFNGGTKQQYQDFRWGVSTALFLSFIFLL
eukprot:m.164986 g.164986  ORF g.164986 m.164986 type:complete len:105 (-) comp21068_c6_seq1:29-343(-)